MVLMFAKYTQNQFRLTVAPQQSLVPFPSPSTFPLPGESKFPGPPALPGALLQLETCLSASVGDLQEITNAIRNDVGLTVQVLRLAAREIEESPEKIVPLSEIVVQVGFEKLRALIDRTQTLSDRFIGDASFRACERFWMHCRLTALVAEERVNPSCGVTADEAYLAGLLRHLGDLPALLGRTAPSNAAASNLLGEQMARAWGYPRVLIDVIAGDRNSCRSSESRTLLDIVTESEMWASRLEFLAARESPMLHSTSPFYALGRN